MRVRLYSENNLATGQNLELSREQAHYVGNVLRLKPGNELFIFNGEAGEFKAVYKDKQTIELKKQTVAPKKESRLELLFAPVKFGKIDYLVQKATELGVTALQPVQTKFTVVGRINYERMKANVIEATEQTGRITIPEIKEMQKLDKLLDNWDTKQKIIFCDESLSGKPIGEALAKLPKADYALLVGPEGGFSQDETAMLKEKKFVIPVTMGKRSLRAETAALAALAVFQASKVG